MTNEIGQRLSTIEDTQTDHGIALRGVTERLDRIIEILTPPDSAGPTLDEILAQLVTVISDQTLILRRIDGRTAAIGSRLGVDEEEAPAPPAAEARPGGGERTNGTSPPHHDDEERSVE